VLKVIFFDAAGTLFHLPEGVGYHYALVAGRVGLKLEAFALERAFRAIWKEMPARPTTREPRVEDDKGWWRDLVNRVLDLVNPSITEFDRDVFFEVAYSHFAEAGVWELYPEVFEVLQALRPSCQLSVISNFDGRLRMILEQLGVSKFFSHLLISSEVGADKPDAYIYQRALEMCGAEAAEALHAGDDPIRDWEGARRAGLRVFELQRPERTLRDLLAITAERG